MSKFSKLLQMILILKSRGRLKGKEIAEAIDISERMVRKYISDLIEAGINVQSVPGPTGGYELIGYDYLLNTSISDEEFIAFKILKERNNYDNKDISTYLNSLEDKLSVKNKLTKEYEDYSANVVLYSKVNSLVHQNNIEIKLHEAIILKRKVRVGYTSVSSGKSIRVIHPYKIITRSELKYLVCYCEKRDMILTLKLIRVEDVEVLEESFTAPSQEVLEQVLKENKIGLITGDDIKVKLLIKSPFAQSVSDRIYSNDQVIIKNDDKSIIFEATLNGKEDIKRWILSMNKYVKVLAPAVLKEEIIKDIQNMLYIYEDYFK